ncbi:hypothetical protein Fcan01_20792 [Folsomia candida]|uniref:Uncharacterized protein n=1 Tax=Folsomia candida TaxID=158441 RepID=A0A226DIQ4_FOLCA|nr:hypothetical protein Fcan01_20792 [Folsomia candida]
MYKLAFASSLVLVVLVSVTSCLKVCIWKKQKMLNDDGTYNVAETEKLVKAVFDTEVQPTLKKAFDECASANSKSFSLDNKCAGYKAFLDCKIKKFEEICEVKMEQ